MTKLRAGGIRKNPIATRQDKLAPVIKIYFFLEYSLAMKSATKIACPRFLENSFWAQIKFLVIKFKKALDID